MKNQSPQLKYFELTIQKGNKKETKYLWASDRANAIRQGNNILKYVPGTPGKVIDARESKP